ncbi:MAG: helix-turn-helix transcriptional regulator [Phycisphaerae bacterium]|nr:helix-turn-helix transcriptional regulator [Phycisphaerae bacterium]
MDSLRCEVLAANLARIDSTWGLPCGPDRTSRDPYARMYCVVSGNADVTHHGRRQDMRTGGLHVIPANTTVRFHCSRRARVLYIHFTAAVLGDMDLFDYLGCPLDLQPKDIGKIVMRLEEIIVAWKGNSPGKELEVKGLLLQLLSPFLAAGDRNKQEDRREELRRFSPVLQYIDANLHRRITLAELAGLFHRAPTYFSRQFVKAMGIPPMRYVLRRRIERGQQVLWNSDETLESIAGQLAFSDAFHFSKTFKRVAGLSPSAFRARKNRFGP